MMPRTAPDSSGFLSRTFRSLDAGELLSHFIGREGIRYFPIIDDSQVSREKTDSVLNDLFIFNEEAHQLEPSFDWTANPSADIEWIILLHKFYYATGLGAAFVETGDQRYLNKWVELTDHWIRTVPPGFLTSDVTARRLQNWVSAYYLFITASDAPVPPDFHFRFLASLNAQATHLKANLTPARNHRTIELWALFLIAVVFPEFDDADRWREFATQELTRNALTDLLADGVHCELSTDYHHLALRNFLHAIRLAKLNGIELPAELHDKIKQALEFSIYVHKPDGAIPALSDGDTGSFLSLLEIGHELYGNEEMLFAATRGEKGTCPAHRTRAFTESGYYIQRSGWGDRGEAYADERYLIFDCGPLGEGNHGHLDLLSFEMAAYGRSLIVDPGRFTYHEPPPGEGTNWRALFRGTSYHNTILVDGLNQTRYEFYKRKFKIRAPAPEFSLEGYAVQDGFEYLHGRAISREYDAIHDRKIVFLPPDYWIIIDVLTAREPHRYDLLFHLSDSACDRVVSSSEDETKLIDSPNLLIAQADDENCVVSIDDGYVSPGYGVKHRAPIVRFTRSGTSLAFHTVLHPYREARPDIRIERLQLQRDGANCNESEASALCLRRTYLGQESKDYFVFDHTGNPPLYQLGSLRFQGRMLHFRTDTNGSLVSRHSLN